MSIVVIIVSVIVLLVLLLVFTFGFFMGLSRKKKDLKLIEKEQKIQKETQKSIIQHFLYENKEVEEEYNDESDIFPVKIINRGYRRLKKFLKFKRLITEIKELDTVRYIRKYFLSYIGIAVLVFGFGYFVKYAVNSAYINIAGRFFIAVIISSALIVLSHFIRKRYKTFSSILMGGAFGSLYITFTISFYNYNIFSTLQVFSIYFLLTLFSVSISLFYNRFELLLLAVVAGFAAPFIAGIDYNNFIVILIYILLLDVASLIIAFFNKNILTRFIPAVFSGVYLILWVYKSFQASFFEEFAVGFIISIFIYIVLTITTIAYSIKKSVQNFIPIELSLPLVVNLIFYSVGMYMMNVLNPEYKGVFTAFIAVINILFLIFVLIVKNKVSKSLIYLFGIISLLFITLIPPVQLVGKTMTIVWAVETVLLLWFSMKLNIKMLKFASMFLIFGLITSFIFDVVENYLAISHNAPEKALLLNKSFISGIMTSLGLGINFIILSRSKDKFLIKPVKMSFFRFFIFIVAVGAFYVSVNTEILYRLTRMVQDANLLNMYMGIYNFAFILLAVVVIIFIKNKTVKIISAIIALLSVAFYFSVYLYEIIKVREHLLMNVSISMNQFIMHTILIASLLFILYFSYINVKNISERMQNIFQWLVSLLFIAVLSTEIDHLSVIYNNHIGTPVSSIINNAHYFYYSLFWMFSALAVSVASLIFKDKKLIRISMFIAVVTGLKIFIYDYTNIDNGQRTVSLIFVGFILLFIAFVRQRLFEKKEINKHLLNENL
ncbi:MAG: DUF2339 domain-containing protein [Bacteroidales bacterium]|nr:DUF2339 domain-containing protein [Bacteroidales bacterium]